VERSATTAAATHANGNASDDFCNRENDNNSACSSARSNDSEVLGGVRYVQLFEVCLFIYLKFV
jgi:hypothetical protein